MPDARERRHRQHGNAILRLNRFEFCALVVIIGVVIYQLIPFVTFHKETPEQRDWAFVNVEPEPPEISIRLPTSVVPDSYDIKIMPFIWSGNFSFNGEVTIYVNVTEETQNITLHARDLRIDRRATAVREGSLHSDTSGEQFKILDQTKDAAREFYTIRTGEPLTAGKRYVIYLKFVGYIHTDLRGFHLNTYTAGNRQRWIASTHFQPINARRAFPCFDEPAFKAKFQISIARSANMVSISNMLRKGESEPALEMAGYVWDHYERSPPMSTYLVAFVVCDFEVRRSSAGNFSIWATPDVISQVGYALDFGLWMLQFFEDYFQIKFPLPKIDVVALPQFPSPKHAIENWGLITGVDQALMLEDTTSSAKGNKATVALTMARALAHQWFGNLVTPNWWNNTWLNDGFAIYFECLAVDIFEPEWKIFERQFIPNVRHMYRLDIPTLIHPLSAKVKSSEEINKMFNKLVFNKGATMVRMMHHFLTDRVFKQGLINYLNENTYQNVNQDDLFEVLTQQAHRDGALPKDMTVKKIMDSWTLQTGYPLISVTRDYNKGRAVITQECFRIEENLIDIMDARGVWWIPLSYTTEAERDFNKTQPSQWMRAQKLMKIRDIGASADQWIMFNIQVTGYYRVNYDKKNWQLIAKQLDTETFGGIPAINRGQMLEDIGALIKAGKLDYSTFLDVSLYLTRETEEIAWTAVLDTVIRLKNMLYKYQIYDYFSVHMRRLLHGIYGKMGFEDKLGETTMTLTIQNVVRVSACTFRHVDCIKDATAQFQKWRDPKFDAKVYNSISQQLKLLVYCTAIRVGAQEEWDFVWTKLLSATNKPDVDTYLTALSCTRDPSVLNRYLELITTKLSKHREADHVAEAIAIIAKNPISQRLLLQFVRNNWTKLKKYVGVELNSIIENFAESVTTVIELQDLSDFIYDYTQPSGNATGKVAEFIHRAQDNIKWFNSHYATIENWLLRNVS